MVEIVTFEPELHLASWQEFIAASYRNADYVLLSPTYLRWQFFDNPANGTGGYTLWLITHRGAVVAQLGYVPFVGRSPKGERFAGAYPINLMVLPQYRAAGLGAVLLKRLITEVPCVLNPGSSEAGADLCIGLGMRDLGLLNRYVAILDVETARRLTADGRLPGDVGTVAPVGEEPGSDLPHVTDRLPARAPPSFPFPIPGSGAERNRAYLRWRYENHPGFRYEFLLTPDLKSLLVFHEEREPQTGALVIRIVDILGDAEIPDVPLKAVLRTAQSRGAALVDFYCSVTCHDAALKRAGFFREAERQDFRIAALFQPLDFRKLGIRTMVAPPQVPGASSGPWYVTKGDSDQDRPNDRHAITRGPVESPRGIP
jgi:GNAT superfamily N-acetyltransferase